MTSPTANHSIRSAVLGLRASGATAGLDDMDIPLSALITQTSVHGSPRSSINSMHTLQAWIDEQAQKETLLSQIASSVLQIHNILLPFASAEFKGTGEAQLSDSIRSIGDVLQRTKEHLVVWKSKRSQILVAFLNPTALISQLRDDEIQLNRQLIILLTSMAVVGYFRDHATNAIVDRLLLKRPPISQDGSGKDPFGPLEQFADVGAREFWKDYIGAKVGCVTNLFIYNS